MNLNELANELNTIASEWDFELTATTDHTDRKVLTVKYWVEDPITGLPVEVKLTVERTLKLKA